MKQEIKVGIIGGSGLDDPDIVSNREEITLDTPFGKPSDVFISGKIEGVPCVLLARHGRKHNILPSDVNYRANIWGFKHLGCTHLVVSTASGSLKEEIKPGDLVLLDSFIDRTTKRQQTLYGSSDPIRQGICHLPMEPAFCEVTRQIVLEAAGQLGLKIHPRGTCITIEGPRFSSKSESRLFQTWGADIINMTTVPEVVLAKEAGLCYAAVALATDYDCWRDTGDKVCVADVLAMFKKNVDSVKKLLKLTVQRIAEREWDETIQKLNKLISESVMGGS